MRDNETRYEPVVACPIVQEEKEELERCYKDVVYFITHHVVDKRTGKHICLTQAQINELRRLEKLRYEQKDKKLSTLRLLRTKI